MTTLGSQLWTGKLSVPQNLQARRLELLMVVSCLNQVTSVVIISHMKVAKQSDGSTTTTMLAFGRLEKSDFCEHTTCSAYLQGAALHLPLAMTLKLQDRLAGNRPQRPLALMREAFPGDPLVSKMTARWITNWFQRRRQPPFSTKAALEKWINDLAPETHDGHDPYCFMHNIKEDGSCFVAGFTIPNLIPNALRRQGEDYLSIDGQFSITVEGFTMQIVGTYDRAHHLLPLAVCVATKERKKALREEVEEDGMPWRRQRAWPIMQTPSETSSLRSSPASRSQTAS